MTPTGPAGSLGELMWPGVPGGAAVLVPIGSVEQHGPHLPLDTDTVIAVAVAEGLASALREDGIEALVAPPVPYGASGEHQDFPGTTSIGTSTLASVVRELVRSLSCWAGSVVLVSGHGGNIPALTESVAGLRREGRTLGWVPCAVGRGDAHAGHVETSIMLHLAPERVCLDLAIRGDCTPMGELLPQLIREGVRAVSANGVLGDPAGSSAEAGAEYLREMIDHAVTGVQRQQITGTARTRRA